MSTSTDEDIVKRRDRHDIVAEILKTAIDGRVKTHIMFRARLSYTQLHEYLHSLVQNGFLEDVKVKRQKKLQKIFKTTQKGIKFLESFETMKSLWSPTNDSSGKQPFDKNS